MSVTGIVAALTAEARTLGSLPDDTLLEISGMGPDAATRAAQALVSAGARNLLSFGLAGALDPQLRAGTVLIADSVTDGSGRSYPTSRPWCDQLTRMAAARTVSGGSMLSVAQPLVDPAAKAQAHARTGARAVDMESFAVGSVAQQAGAPFAIVRVIIDTAADALPRSVTAATGSRGEVHLAQLLFGLLRAPSDLPALLRLSRRYRAAMASLRYLGERGVRLS